MGAVEDAGAEACEAKVTAVVKDDCEDPLEGVVEMPVEISVDVIERWVVVTDGAILPHQTDPSNRPIARRRSAWKRQADFFEYDSWGPHIRVAAPVNCQMIPIAISSIIGNRFHTVRLIVGPCTGVLRERWKGIA